MGSKLKEIEVVDGVEYIRVDQKPSAYIYKYIVDNGKEMFEVFKKQKDSYGNEAYPEEADFEKTAFSYHTLNEAMRKFNQL